MALYLTYRPQSFADVVGQDHIVTTLEQSIGQGRISHAYLLCGTRGTGKTSIARILAKTILLQGMDDSAMKAQATKGIEEGSFVDLIEIDAASNRRIDDIRELIEKIQFSPAVSKAKVYIIDEVHMMTKEAFNALLKTLEEPPEYAYFILATTELHKVPDTIQSRCQRFLFKRVRDEDIVRRLQYIADQERITIDRDALRAIARHALGSFRDGISLLDQLRSLPSISLDDVTDRIGKTSAVFIEDIANAITNHDMKQMKEIVLHIEESNIPVDLIASDLLALIRTHLHEAIEQNADTSSFLAMTDILLEALRHIRLSPVPALALESALLSLCVPDTAKAQSRKLQTAPMLQVKQEEKIEKALPVAAKQESLPERKEALIEAADFTVPTILHHWKEIVDGVSPASVRMSLKNGTVAAAENDTLELAFPSAFHRDRVAETQASRTIEDILLKILKRPVRLKLTLDKNLKPLPSGPSTDLVEAAAEVFGAM